MGQATRGYLGDGGPAQSALFSQPTQVAIDSQGNLYELDSGNLRIRKLTGAPPSTPPSIQASGVVNSASYSGTNTLAPGELFTIFGSNLSPTTQIFSLLGDFVPLVLGSTRVNFGGNYAPVIAVSPGQVNAIMPWGISTNGIPVQVEVDGVPSEPLNIATVASVPALFTADASGKGQGSIVNQDGTVNSPSNPALRGSFISVFGTGGGATNPPSLNDGLLAVAAPYGTISGVTATVGGATSQVLYAGVAPFLVAGVMQINLQIPTGIAVGNVPVAVSIGGAAANTVTVSVK